MSRSGYDDDCEDPLLLGRWRAQVRSAIRGKRGQTFLKDLLAALDAMPRKRLITDALQIEGNEDVIVGGDELVARDGSITAMGEVCALGALGKARGMDLSNLDPDEPEEVAEAFDIAHQLAREVVYMNDEGGWRETPEQRFDRMREWVSSLIAKEAA